MTKDDEETGISGEMTNDDSRNIKINEQRELPKGFRLGTNPKPDTPKPEPVDED